MTRYARAKGSKASNERLPNEATPWHVMKQQLIENSGESKDAQQKPKSAKELLNEKEQPYYCTSLGNLNNDWAEFEEVTSKIKVGDNKDVKHKNIRKSKKKKQELHTNKNAKRDNNSISNGHNENVVKHFDNIEHDNNDVSSCTKKKKRETRKRKLSDTNYHDSDQNISLAQEKPLNNQKHNINKQHKSVSENVSNVHRRLNTQGNKWKNSVSFNKSNSSSNDDNNYDCVKNTEKEGTKRQNEHYDQRTNYAKKYKDNFDNGPTNFKNNQGRFTNSSRVKGKDHLKPPKVRDNIEHKRRKPVGTSKIVINGMEVEVASYDGFPVQKHDAERLKELKQKMIMKGIPKSEIDAAMKLERRRAEKALARLRKSVCFHCRKSGHNLSDCPELASEQAGTGICFKCGSTEHTHFECKVNRSSEYRFATCFICREQGHIAKQCPDNPKGVYPQGGSCKVCGDVTHLKKDCPELLREKEESTVTADRITESTEALEPDSVKKEAITSVKQRIVKF